jgi:hypothetical protein
MDQATFLGGSKSIVNIMNCTCYDTPLDPNIPIDKFIKAFKIMPKLKYKIKEICGDFYYEEMSEEETIKKAFIVSKEMVLKDKDDIDRFAQDNINIKMPLDGPLWRLYI